MFMGVSTWLEDTGEIFLSNMNDNVIFGYVLHRLRRLYSFSVLLVLCFNFKKKIFSGYVHPIMQRSDIMLKPFK
jgi:hypothetical protein